MGLAQTLPWGSLGVPCGHQCFPFLAQLGKMPRSVCGAWGPKDCTKRWWSQRPCCEVSAWLFIPLLVPGGRGFAEASAPPPPILLEMWRLRDLSGPCLLRHGCRFLHLPSIRRSHGEDLLHPVPPAGCRHPSLLFLRHERPDLGRACWEAAAESGRTQGPGRDRRPLTNTHSFKEGSHEATQRELALWGEVASTEEAP